MTTSEEHAREKAQYFSGFVGLTDQELKDEVGAAFALFVTELKAVPPGRETWKPTEDQWSAAEIGDHLVLSTGAVANVIRTLAQGRRVTDADWDPPPQFRGESADVEDVWGRIQALPAEAETLNRAIIYLTQ